MEWGNRAVAKEARKWGGGEWVMRGGIWCGKGGRKGGREFVSTLPVNLFYGLCGTGGRKGGIEFS